jgi:ferric-dicitrate binding protein FerR (iron transport regulator)
VYELVEKYFQGSLSVREKNDLLQQAETDPELRRAFIQRQNLQSLLELAPKSGDVEYGRSKYEDFLKERENHIKRVAISRFWKYFAAASVVLLILIGSYTYFRPAEIKNIEIFTGIGEMRTIELPDGSKVMLNVCSKIVYPERYKKGRCVYLEGEAFFSVKHDDKKPFTVNAGEMKIIALGTVFNVASYSDCEISSSTLTEGKISVSFGENLANTIELVPYEKFTYNKKSKTINKQIVDIEDETAWTKGYLIIQNKKLNEIYKIIGRKYGVEVYINNSRLGNVPVTLKIKSGESIDELMQIIKYIIPDLNYKIEDKKLYIY